MEKFEQLEVLQNTLLLKREFQINGFLLLFEG